MSLKYFEIINNLFCKLIITELPLRLHFHLTQLRLSIPGNENELMTHISHNKNFCVRTFVSYFRFHIKTPVETAFLRALNKISATKQLNETFYEKLLSKYQKSSEIIISLFRALERAKNGKYFSHSHHLKAPSCSRSAKRKLFIIAKLFYFFYVTKNVFL